MRAKVSSLTELDELIGKHVLGESPETHWQDSHSLFLFDTEQEALEAIRNSFYQLFLPEADWTTAEVRKIQIYRLYSSDFKAVWEVIEQVAKEKPLNLQRTDTAWVASFGDHARMSAKNAPVAICLAALRASGIEVELAWNFSEKSPDNPSRL